MVTQGANGAAQSQPERRKGDGNPQAPRPPHLPGTIARSSADALLRHAAPQVCRGAIGCVNVHAPHVVGRVDFRGNTRLEPDCPRPGEDGVSELVALRVVDRERRFNGTLTLSGYERRLGTVAHATPNARNSKTYPVLTASCILALASTLPVCLLRDERLSRNGGAEKVSLSGLSLNHHVHDFALPFGS